MKNSQRHLEKRDLLDLYLEGKLEKDQLSCFLQFLQTTEGQELLAKHMDRTGFSAEGSLPPADKDREERIYRQINLQMDQQSQKRSRWYLRIAASFLLLIAAGAGIHYSGKLSEQTVTDVIQVADDRQQMLTLPDGTRVRLNSGSKLTYSADINKQDKRQISLTGEAFFEVAKNPEKPFVIDVGSAEVNVLGTKFNVRSSALKNRIVVAVQEGKVSFKKKEQGEGILLTANEIGILNEGGHIEKVVQPVQNYFSWFERFLEFDEMPLPQVLEQLKVIFDVDVELADPDLSDKHFTAYMRGTSVDQVIDQLALSFELKMEKKDRKFLLRK